MEKREDSPDIQKPKKMDGIGFWIIVLFAILKDILDGFAGATLVLSIFTILFSITIYMIIWTYLFFNNVGFVDKFAARKLAALIIPFIIEMIPFLNIVPTTTVSLFLVRTMENHERFRKFVHLATQSGSPVDRARVFREVAKTLSIPESRIASLRREATA